MAPKNKTRFLLVSDTHANPAKPKTFADYAFRMPLPEADVLIHSGDLTYNGKLQEHETTVSLLKSVKAELKIVIPGNHDLTLDTEYYARKGDLWGPRPKYDTAQLQEIRDLYTGPEAVAAGISYVEEGTYTFHLKSGTRLTVYASAYTPEFCEWAFAYPHEQDRFNSSNSKNLIASHNASTENEKNNIDIIVTHGPPHTILDLTTRNENVGCPHLLDAITRSRPLLHCFGHIHEGWGAIKKSWPVTPSNPPVHNTTTTTSADLKLMKQQQLELWTRNHAREETNVVVDKKKMVNDRAVFVDATDLKRGQETLFVNASIMDYQYNPVQGPWVVDLMLDTEESV